MSKFHATVKYFQKTSLEAILSFDYAEWYQNGKFWKKKIKKVTQQFALNDLFIISVKWT